MSCICFAFSPPSTAPGKDSCDYDCGFSMHTHDFGKAYDSTIQREVRDVPRLGEEVVAEPREWVQYQA